MLKGWLRVALALDQEIPQYGGAGVAGLALSKGGGSL